MTAYRAGQRVRAEWPDGSAVEGKIISPEHSDGDLMLRYMDGSGIWLSSLKWSKATVTVLPEPRPDEPTGLGAVVDDRLGTVWVRVDHRGSGFACWREVTPGRYDSDACMREWKHLDAVRILSEGWTP